jgi:hypothetical protein
MVFVASWSVHVGLGLWVVLALGAVLFVGATIWDLRDERRHRVHVADEGSPGRAQPAGAFGQAGVAEAGAAQAAAFASLGYTVERPRVRADFGAGLRSGTGPDLVLDAPGTRVVVQANRWKQAFGLLATHKYQRHRLRVVFGVTLVLVAVVASAPSLASEFLVIRHPAGPVPEAAGVVVPDSPFLSPPNPEGPGFQGQPHVIELNNRAATLCGPAAEAFAATYWGLLAPPEDTNAVIESMTARHPPDVLGGRGGTSPFRILSALRAEGLVNGGWAAGTDTLKEWVAARFPVIVLLDLHQAGSPDRGMHWTAVYGFDDDNVYLTNFGFGIKDAQGDLLPDDVLPWRNFERGWAAGLTRLTATAGQFLAVFPAR